MPENAQSQRAGFLVVSGSLHAGFRTAAILLPDCCSRVIPEKEEGCRTS